jgi:hypothetical protein
MKYWEIIADRLSKSGWSWRCVAVVKEGRQGSEFGSELTIESEPGVASEWRQDKRASWIKRSAETMTGSRL